MARGEGIPLPPSSQSDIDEIENLMYATAAVPAVLPATGSSPSRPTTSPFLPSSFPPPAIQPNAPPPPAAAPRPANAAATTGAPSGAAGLGSPPDTLTEPVWETVKRDLSRIVGNLRLVVFPHPNREDPGKALRDWDLWGPFFFIIFLGMTLSWSASVKKSEVFAVAFAVLAAGAVILTLNVLFLGGRIIFFQSLSLLGYCLFPLDAGALIACVFGGDPVIKIAAVFVALVWSTWAAYPFVSSAVGPRRKALALYPVFLMYISVGFLIVAVN